MSDRTVQRQKSAASNFTNPSLTLPGIPTLANPIRGFGSQINTAPPQTVTEVAPDIQKAQSADGQSSEPEVIKEKPLSHDISRISLHRPQAKLTVGEPGDKYEQEADMMANQIMAMPDYTLQREAMPEEEEIQTKPLNASIQRDILPEDEIQTKRSLQQATNGSLLVKGNLESQLDSSQSVQRDETATAEQSQSPETAMDVPAATALIPFDRNPLSSPGEQILFNSTLTDPTPNNFQLVYTGVGGNFDTRTGLATKTIPGLRSGNLPFFIDQNWNGTTPVTVQLQVQRTSNNAVVNTYNWTFGRKTNIPTTITQQEPETERPLPSTYSYKIGPDLIPTPGDDYLHQTILETFGQRTCNIVLADLSPAFRSANSGITTPEQITAHFFGTSSNNGTFTVSAGDMIYDQHGGGMPDISVFQAALTTMKEIYVELPQTYEVQPGVALGQYTIRRILKIDGSKMLKKTKR